MPRVCMILTNPCVNDSRVLREARALAAAGYEVRIVATQAEGVPPTEERDGFRIVRVPSEPRLSGALRRLLVRLSGLRPRAAPASRAEPGATGGPEEESVLGQDAWVAAAGEAPDRALLRDPRAAAIRFWLRLHQTLAWWRFGRAALDVVRREPADVYVAHDLNTLPLGVLAKSRLGGRLVYDSHELFTEVSPAPPPSPLWRPRWRLAERLLIGRADAVITVCDGIAGELVDRYGIERPAVVRNIPELAEAPRRRGGRSARPAGHPVRCAGRALPRWNPAQSAPRALPRRRRTAAGRRAGPARPGGSLLRLPPAGLREELGVAEPVRMRPRSSRSWSRRTPGTPTWG